MRFVAMSLCMVMLSPVIASRVMANEPASATNSKSSSSSSTSASSSAQAAKGEDLTAAERSLLSQGYKLRIVDGEKRFCHRETVLGSNLEKTVCTTAARYAESQQTGRDITEQMQRNQANPNGH